MLYLRRLPRCSITPHRVRWWSSTKPIETDQFGIPVKPTWSVNTLLSSYPSPTIAPETLKKLYNLSAFVAPKEGTPEHAKITRELEEMVRMVEAVKLVDTEGTVVAAQAGEEDLDRALYGNPDVARNGDEENGRDLLKHATRTAGEYYVVEADRMRAGS